MLISFSLIIVEICNLATGSGPHHPKGPHNHYKPNSNDEDAPKLTQDTQLLHDKEHMKEDLKDLVHDDFSEKMSPLELEFYYFKIHDADNNTKLDGLEILRAIEHTAHDEQPTQISGLGTIMDLIDAVLEEDDTDKDGYLSYVEYVMGRNRDDRNSATHESITR